MASQSLIQGAGLPASLESCKAMGVGLVGVTHTHTCLAVGPFAASPGEREAAFQLCKFCPGSLIRKSAKTLRALSSNASLSTSGTQGGIGCLILILLNLLERQSIQSACAGSGAWPPDHANEFPKPQIRLQKLIGSPEAAFKFPRHPPPP